MKGPLQNNATGQILVAPSILAADFAALGHDIGRVGQCGADIIHVDVMDGHFVPNISVGPPVIGKIRHCSELTFDVHLMITYPDRYLEAFAKAGADHITIHVESEGDTRKTLARIRELGCSAGITLRPGTSVEALAPFLDQVAMVLVMTVEPGFGGQSFMDSMIPKLEWLRTACGRLEKPFWIEVDGGIDAATAPRAIRAGANVLVAGTSVFASPYDIREAIANLRGK